MATSTRHSALRARAKRPDGGQVLAFLSLFLIGLFAVLGIGVDGGSLYLHRRGTQLAADASALAGARLLGTTTSTGAAIRADIEKYARINLIDNPATNVTAYYTNDAGARVGKITSASGTPPAGATGVEVVAIKQAPTFFLPIIGINRLEVSAIAGARGRPANGGGPGYAIFGIQQNQRRGSKVIDWSSGGWTVTGTIHSNSDIDMSGTGNTINGNVEDVTGANPTGLKGKATLNPSTNNPVQSTVMPDPVNKTLNDFYQGKTSTATYHYINGSTNLTSYIVNGVLKAGVYYVNGNINFATGLSLRVPSTVTLVATGSITVSSPTMNFMPYSQGMLFFANITTSNTGLNVSGSNGSWNGIVYAPHSDLRISGSANTSAFGSAVGYHVTVTGSGRLTYNPSYSSTPSTAEIILYE
jgi:hypothetical protein